MKNFDWAVGIIHTLRNNFCSRIVKIILDKLVGWIFSKLVEHLNPIQGLYSFHALEICTRSSYKHKET
jgi:hypothetical protein